MNDEWDEDKTQFMGGQDNTIMRPSPGRRQPQQRPIVPNVSDIMPKPPVSSPGRSAPVNFQQGEVLNELVGGASTLLALMIKIRSTLQHDNVKALFNTLSNEVRRFDSVCRAKGIEAETQLAARYVLCTALDEMVLSTPWGSQSNWPQQSLLGSFHNENSGGEKVFQILEHMKNNPAQNLNMLELLYLCISLGFAGKYRIHASGRDHLEQIRAELYFLIQQYKGESERELSPSWKNDRIKARGLTEFLPAWVVAAAVSAILVSGYSAGRYLLNEASTPIYRDLTSIVEIKSAQTIKNTFDEGVLK